MGKDSLKNKTATGERVKVNHYLTSDTKINSKRTKDPNLGPETVKLLQENIRGELLNTGLSAICFLLDTKAKAIKAEIKRDHIEPKGFCTRNKIINKMKNQPTI